MRIPLNEFEQYVDEVILQRGRSYWKNGRVQTPEELRANEYEAIVKGTTEYRVHLEIQAGVVEEFSCTCPYDVGPVCKHVAALLYYIQRQEFVGEKSNTRRQPNKISMKPTVERQVNSRLESLSSDDLKQFVSEIAIHDPKIRRKFLLRYAQQSDTKQFYAQQIKSILQTGKRGYGFIDWNTARDVGIAVDEIVSIARDHCTAGQHKNAMVICSAVLEEMTKALQISDDSNGDIGGSIQVALSILDEISVAALSDEFRSEYFKYCTNAFQRKLFIGWDWHLGMLRFAANIARTDIEVETILTLLISDPGSEYDVENRQIIQYNLLLKHRGKKTANAYLENHITNAAFRTISIEQAINEKNYERAITLARDGIRHDEKKRPGLATDWLEWLLTIARVQRNKKDIVVYAHELFLSRWDAYPEYYAILKNQVPKKEWKGFVDQLVLRISTASKFLDIDRIGWIYVQEERWEALIRLLQQNPDLHYLDRFEKHLSHRYAGELAALYEHCIVLHLKDHTGRQQYQYACRYIRRMIKIGERKRANELINRLRKLYLNRKALLEELEKI